MRIFSTASCFRLPRFAHVPLIAITMLPRPPPSSSSVLLIVRSRTCWHVRFLYARAWRLWIPQVNCGCLLLVVCCLLFISLFFVRGLVHSASSHWQIVVTLYVIPMYARCLQPSLTFFDRWPRVYHFDVHVAFDREGSFLHLSVRMVLSVALCFSSLLAPAISLSDQQTQDALILVRFFMPWLRSNCIAR